jgi:hypothetical protein
VPCTAAVQRPRAPTIGPPAAAAAAAEVVAAAHVLSECVMFDCAVAVSAQGGSVMIQLQRHGRTATQNAHIDVLYAYCTGPDSQLMQSMAIHMYANSCKGVMCCAVC